MTLFYYYLPRNRWLTTFMILTYDMHYLLSAITLLAWLSNASHYQPAKSVSDYNRNKKAIKSRDVGGRVRNSNFSKKKKGGGNTHTQLQVEAALTLSLGFNFRIPSSSLHATKITVWFLVLNGFPFLYAFLFNLPTLT